MPLDNVKRAAIRSRFVSEALGVDTCRFTKLDLSAAADAADDWCTTNAASYNTALPEPFKSTATPAQKAALLAYVALARFGA